MSRVAMLRRRCWTPLARVALLAFLSMCANDLILTVMVVFESRYRAIPAGVFDILGWLSGLVCSALAIEEIVKNGWRTRKAKVLIIAISAANFFGTVAGVYLAKALS